MKGKKHPQRHIKRLKSIMVLASKMVAKGFKRNVALSFAHSYFKNKSNTIFVEFTKKSTGEIVQREGKILPPALQQYSHTTKYYDFMREGSRMFVNDLVINLKSIPNSNSK